MGCYMCYSSWNGMSEYSRNDLEGNVGFLKSVCLRYLAAVAGKKKQNSAVLATSPP